jgi:hypothetical protein
MQGQPEDAALSVDMPHAACHTPQLSPSPASLMLTCKHRDVGQRKHKQLQMACKGCAVMQSVMNIRC